MVTEVPTGPEVGDRRAVERRVGTVKLTALLARPAMVTSTLPVAAPLGTGATMLVALQLVGVAAVPLKVTELVQIGRASCRARMVTEVPTGPEVGDKLVMLGGVVSVKLTALLARPATVTSTLPVAAPLGTEATMLVALQLVGVAFVPLKVTELVP